MIDVPSVNLLHTSTVARWHTQPVDHPYGDPQEALANSSDPAPEQVLAIICQQHQFNYLLWHEEDIDKYNQARNDWIEKVDDWITADLQRKQIHAAAEAKLNTETPGSAIDRLSIMSLRIYHLKEQLDRADIDQAHIDKVSHRLAVCGLQFADLSNSLAELLTDIYAGTKRHKTYRQMKMYNDPSLNPYLYNRQAKTS